jgi:hypothetical protein
MFKQTYLGAANLDSPGKLLRDCGNIWFKHWDITSKMKISPENMEVIEYP